MLRYADAIVKRGVDKLIDAIAHNPEPQTKNAETPQPQKSMGNDTDCAPQTTGNTTNRGLTEQAFSLMDELCDFRYNVLDRTPEVQRRDQAGKGLVLVSKLVRNTMVIAPFNSAESDGIRILRQNPQDSDVVTLPRHHIARIEYQCPSSCVRLTPQSHGSELLLCPSCHAVVLRACGQAHYNECRTVRP